MSFPAQPLVLIVDDSAVTCAFVAEQLLQLDCRCVIARNGQEAVELFINESVQLILMDVYMPVLDGLKATAAIRRLEHQVSRPPVPIMFFIAVSAQQLNRYHAKTFKGMQILP